MSGDPLSYSPSLGLDSPTLDQVKQEVAPAALEAEQAAAALAALAAAAADAAEDTPEPPLAAFAEKVKPPWRQPPNPAEPEGGTAAAPAGSLPEPGGLAAEAGTRVPSPKPPPRDPAPAASPWPPSPKTPPMGPPTTMESPQPTAPAAVPKTPPKGPPATRVSPLPETPAPMTSSKAPFMAPLFEAEAHPGRCASSRAAGAAPLTAFGPPTAPPPPAPAPDGPDGRRSGTGVARTSEQERVLRRLQDKQQRGETLCLGCSETVFVRIVSCFVASFSRWCGINIMYARVVLLLSRPGQSGKETRSPEGDTVAHRVEARRRERGFV